MVKQGGKLSRAGKTVRCMLCKELGHNKRSCKGQKMGPKPAATNKKRNTSAKKQAQGKASKPSAGKDQQTSTHTAPHSPPARASQGIVIRDSRSANTRSSRKQAADANKDPKNKEVQKGKQEENEEHNLLSIKADCIYTTIWLCLVSLTYAFFVDACFADGVWVYCYMILPSQVVRLPGRYKFGNDRMRQQLIIRVFRDIENVARTPFGRTGTNQYTVSNPGYGHPHIVEGGFGIRILLKHLNPLTWPEVLRQFALSAGFGPQLKKKIKVKRSSLPKMDEIHNVNMGIHQQSMNMQNQNSLELILGPAKRSLFDDLDM
ncbi:HB1/Asxl, restriction endonuclease HTH domain-containing protein [Artemisia annua]|uniref:HB1/Asxl, restriction endonuclease HTH domain-containing protein n=1 Tax=Artemisia annua TaxID=35608 RepID=A0A2U1QHB6_ARTAN|nr:HB1/Asxl, restriction endonuclease HTH domain-containing protein [Artemisia annua]